MGFLDRFKGPRRLRCMESNCRHEFEAREVEFLCESEKHERRFFRSGGDAELPTAATCDFRNPDSGEPCGANSVTRVCPKCHQPLSRIAGFEEERLIALVGTSESGKSHYLTVVYRQLQALGGHFGLGYQLIPAEDSRRERFNTDYFQRLIDHDTVIAKTSVDRPAVLIFQASSRRSGGDEPEKRVTLLFYDMAGEKYDDYKRIAGDVPWIGHCKGVLLLLEPSQFASVRRCLPPAIAQGDYITAGDLVANVRDAIRATNRNLPRDRPIPIPLAVCCNKLDLMRDLDVPQRFRIEPDSPIFLGESHARRGLFSAAIQRQIRGEMEALLGGAKPKWDVNLVGLLGDFETYELFGMTVTGRSPENGRFPRGIAPRRVLDPLLWIFSQMELLERGED